MSRRATPRRNALMGGLLLGLCALGFGYPFLMQQKGTGIAYDKALGPQAKIRGVFINSGSRDAGPDGTAMGAKRRQEARGRAG